MMIVAFVFSLFIAAVGVLGVLSPRRFLGLVRQFQRPGGLYAAAILRVVLGVVLLFTAPTSRLPEVVRVFGIVILVAGLITPLFGLKRFGRLLDWWSARGSLFMRVWAGFAIAFGLFLAYAVST